MDTRVKGSPSRSLSEFGRVKPPHGKALKAVSDDGPSETDRSGDTKSARHDALRTLYARHYDELRGYLRRLIGSGPPEPEDIVQRAFANIAEREDLSDIKNPPAFLWRAAQNILISEQRAMKVRANSQYETEEIFSPPRGDDFDPERVLIARSEIARVMSVLAKMPEKRRRIFLMRRMDDLSNAEIGRRLGLSRSTVSEHMARAMLDIDTLLNGPENEG